MDFVRADEARPQSSRSKRLSHRLVEAHAEQRLFTHCTETRRKIERNSSSGSSHAESGDGAGKSGKF